MAKETKVILKEGKASTIRVPRDISEQSRIAGFVFSDKLLKAAKIEKLKLLRSIAEGQDVFNYAGLPERLHLAAPAALRLGRIPSRSGLMAHTPTLVAKLTISGCTSARIIAFGCRREAFQKARYY